MSGAPPEVSLGKHARAARCPGWCGHEVSPGKLRLADEVGMGSSGCLAARAVAGRCRDGWLAGGDLFASPVGGPATPNRRSARSAPLPSYGHRRLLDRAGVGPTRASFSVRTGGEIQEQALFLLLGVAAPPSQASVALAEPRFACPTEAITISPCPTVTAQGDDPPLPADFLTVARAKQLQIPLRHAGLVSASTAPREHQALLWRGRPGKQSGVTLRGGRRAGHRKRPALARCQQPSSAAGIHQHTPRAACVAQPLPCLTTNTRDAEVSPGKHPATAADLFGWVAVSPGKHALNVRTARPAKDAIVMIDDSARKFRQDHTADVARARIYTDATTSPEKGRGLCPSAGQAEPMHRATRAYLPASKASPCPHPHGSSEAPPTPSPRHRSRPQHLALSSVRSMMCRFRHGRHRRAHPKNAPAPLPASNAFPRGNIAVAKPPTPRHSPQDETTQSPPPPACGDDPHRQIATR